MSDLRTNKPTWSELDRLYAEATRLCAMQAEQLDTERIARQEAERERDDLRSSRPINVPALAARLQSVREMARDAAMARAIEDIIYDMLPRPTGTEGLIEKVNTAP